MSTSRHGFARIAVPNTVSHRPRSADAASDPAVPARIRSKKPSIPGGRTQKSRVQPPPAPVPQAPAYRREGARLVVTIPVRTVNEANTPNLIGKKRARYRREVHHTVAACLALVPRNERPTLPVVVTLTRHSAGRPDPHDGLRNALKSAVDEIAAWLGLPVNARGHAEDSDPRVTWDYARANSPRGQHWITVDFEPRADGGAR